MNQRKYLMKGGQGGKEPGTHSTNVFMGPFMKSELHEFTRCIAAWESPGKKDTQAILDLLTWFAQEALLGLPVPTSWETCAN